MTCLLAIRHSLATCLLLVSVCQGINFDQDYLAVWFSPYISKYVPRNSYNQSHLIAMTSQISTKFRKMMIPPFTLTKDHNVGEIPMAVATFNKFNRRREQPPLELTMMFKQADFESTKRAADEANAVFPNTVNTLLYFPDKLKDNTSDVVNITTGFRSEISLNSSIPYKFGIYMPIEACGPSKSLLSPQLNSILSLVDAAYFYFFPTFPWYYIYKHGAEYSVRKITNMVLSCKTKLMQVAPSLDVGLRTHWPDTGKDSVQNVTGFLRFWSMLNEFAKETKTTMVPSEAFDNPYKAQQQVGYDTLGWWRLVEHGHAVTNPADFVFEEKKTAGNVEGSKSQPNDADAPSLQSQLDVMPSTDSSLVHNVAEKLDLDKAEEVLNQIFKLSKAHFQPHNLSLEVNLKMTFAKDGNYKSG